MNPELFVTSDGSHSLRIRGTETTYHSKSGAISESRHVFINAGLRPLLNREDQLPVLEIGFGTGLNALLTYMEGENSKKPIHYECIDTFWLEPDLVASLNYCECLNRSDLKSVFTLLHDSDLEKKLLIGNYFQFQKIQCSLLDFNPSKRFQIIYLDTFAPDEQPELWTLEVFDRLYHWLLPRGLVVTYSAKGAVRRALSSAGFIIERLPGYFPKKEMTRAIRK
ncbi:MAG: tRNA (5-methylaminomethyl-2-thiouridine)(34)-methyltransferase MnmD [Chitinophagales bacterium]